MVERAQGEAAYDLGRPDRPSRPPPEHAENRWLLAASLALVLGAAGAVTFLVLSTPSPPAIPPPTVTVTPNASAAAFPTSPEFWGGNVGTSSPLAGLFTGEAAGTPVTYYRWPGGQAGDGINYTTGTLVNATSGTPSNVTTNLTTFVTWCETFGCHAILQLPAEIDDPATAAYDVEYTEKVLAFHPSYWEIGNEPAIWTHFGIPWSKWNSSQQLNATPGEFAQVVRTYDLAIRAVDPAAPIIGLGGVGTGAYQEATWIRATVAVNGPNLTAVAIHVYPAGTPPNGTATLAQFYSNLSGARSLADRIPPDRAAILAGCITCTHLKLLVSEFGSASSPGSFSGFEVGFPQVPFVAHEIAQGLDLGVAGMYLRQLATPHSGSWVDTANGTSHPLLVLYNVLLPLLGSEVIPTNVTPSDPSVAVAATEAGPNGSRAILVVNGNASEPVTVHLPAPLVDPGSGTFFAWNASVPLPVQAPVDLNLSSVWHLPPMSLLVILSGPPSGGPTSAVHAASPAGPGAMSDPVGGGPIARPRP